MTQRIGGLLSGLLLVSAFAHAQDSEIEAMQPAVDSETLATVADTDSAREEDIAALEPEVTTDNLVAASAPATSSAIDELDLGRTEITGNQELPTVLYIVPWQKSDPGELMARPGNSLLDEVLAPVDRGEFVRQVDYYGDLFEAQEEE